MQRNAHTAVSNDEKASTCGLGRGHRHQRKPTATNALAGYSIGLADRERLPKSRDSSSQIDLELLPVLASGWNSLRLTTQIRSVPLAGHAISVSQIADPRPKRVFSSTYNRPLLASGLRIPSAIVELFPRSKPCSEN